MWMCFVDLKFYIIDITLVREITLSNERENNKDIQSVCKVVLVKLPKHELIILSTLMDLGYV